MKILILGQTPPPYGGQAINIEKMLQVLDQRSLTYRFIRMDFSTEINDMGKPGLRKIAKLGTIFLRLLYQLVVYRPGLVYYPPAGPQKVPVFRDMALLFPVRLFRFNTIFHFHAGGLSEIYNTLSRPARWLFRFCYFEASHAICLSEQGKKDPLFLKSKNIAIIPSGTEDIGFERLTVTKDRFIVLFAGLCSESKGILDFIAVLRKAQQTNRSIFGVVLGKPFSAVEKNAIDRAVEEGLIGFEGVVAGTRKRDFFSEADLFLFPSFFESENFPTVIIEAFSAGLPVVATRWRGIPDQVQDGYNGFIHEVHDIEGMTGSVIKLASDTALRKRHSLNARHDFETRYTMTKFASSMANFYKSVR